MRVKAIKDLCQLSDVELVHEITVGIGHVNQHATRLFSEAQTFSETSPRSYQIVSAVASEECAKILILLDVLRMTEHELSNRGRQLGYFNDHLAKGIYVEYCWTRPASFHDVREFVKRERLLYYCDGPNDNDWIFRNRILRRRDERMYVDYVETDEGRTWWTPDEISPIESSVFLRPPEPDIWRLVRALEGAGALEVAALREVQRYWRKVPITDGMHWQEVRAHNRDLLRILNGKGLLKDEGSAMAVVDDWLFPLYMLDLTPGDESNRYKR